MLNNDLMEGLKQYKTAVETKFPVTKVMVALGLYLIIKLLSEFIGTIV
jgi:hypothetical protein